MIDPNTEKDKLSKLHDQLVENYGSQIQAYKNFLAEWDKQYKQFEQLTTTEAAAMTAVTGGATLDDSDDDQIQRRLPARSDSHHQIASAQPRDRQRRHQHRGTQKYPDWKKAADGMKDFLQQLSDLSGSLATNFGKLKDEKDVPENVRKYMTDKPAALRADQEDADALIQQASKLGELKLDQLEDGAEGREPDPGARAR